MEKNQSVVIMEHNKSLLRSLNFFVCLFYSASILACYIPHCIKSNTGLNCKIFKKSSVKEKINYTHRIIKNSAMKVVIQPTCLCKLITVLRIDEKLDYCSLVIASLYSLYFLWLCLVEVDMLQVFWGLSHSCRFQHARHSLKRTTE